MAAIQSEANRLELCNQEKDEEEKQFFCLKIAHSPIYT